MLRILGHIPLNFFLISGRLFTQRRFKEHFGWYFIGLFYLIALYFLGIYKFILYLYRSTKLEEHDTATGKTIQSGDTIKSSFQTD
jgi:cytochrome c-type biogenesis protein CcmE